MAEDGGRDGRVVEGEGGEVEGEEGEGEEDHFGGVSVGEVHPADRVCVVGLRLVMVVVVVVKVVVWFLGRFGVGV